MIRYELNVVAHRDSPDDHWHPLRPCWTRVTGADAIRAEAERMLTEEGAHEVVISTSHPSWAAPVLYTTRAVTRIEIARVPQHGHGSKAESAT
jgi:hypothetical protein